MTYYDLDQDEQVMLDDIEAGNFVTVKDVEAMKKQAIAAAKNTLNKTTNINIRLSQRDVLKLKARAAREGLPYQTLAASLLHQAAA
jgi:predicted DNA binding CopG/RHH family protein